MIKYRIRQNWRDFSELTIVDEALNGRTIRKERKSQVVGLIGELTFGRYLLDNQIEFSYLANKSMDFDFEIDGVFIDVKSGFCNLRPQNDWHCRIPTYQEFQRTDLYVFANVSDADVYLMGWISKDAFWHGNKSWLVNKGEIDRKEQLTDNRIISVSDLNQMEDLLTFLTHYDRNAH